MIWGLLSVSKVRNYFYFGYIFSGILRKCLKMEAPRRLSTPYQVRTRSVPGPYQVRIYNYGEGTEKLRRRYGPDTEIVRRRYGPDTEIVRRRYGKSPPLHKNSTSFCVRWHKNRIFAGQKQLVGLSLALRRMRKVRAT